MLRPNVQNNSSGQGNTEYTNLLFLFRFNPRENDRPPQVNNEDVRKKPHTELLLLVGSLQTEVCLKVVHVPKFKILSFEAKKFRKEKKEEQKVSDTSTGEKVRPSF